MNNTLTPGRGESFLSLAGVGRKRNIIPRVGWKRIVHPEWVKNNKE